MELVDSNHLKRLARKSVWVRSPPWRPFFCWDVFQFGRKADFESANLGSSPSAPTNAVVMEQADMRDSKPRALKSVQVRFLPAAPISGLLRQWQTTRLLSAGM